MNDVQRQLGGFLRSLDQSQFLRFCRMIRINPPDPNSGLSLTWDQWKDNKVVGILGAKHNNPPYYESVVLHAFPGIREGQELLRYMLSLDDSDLLDFYKQIMDKSALVLHAAARPQFALEILDCEEMDPARWTRALRQSGVQKPEKQQPEPIPEPTSQSQHIAEPTPSTSSARSTARHWTRGEILAALAIIVAIILAAITWLIA